MSLDDLEKLRSIRQGGKTKGKARIRKLSDRGKTTGYEVDYSDGRTAAVVKPDPIRVRMSLSGRDDE